MSPALKSKSKDKSSGKVTKEPQKVSSKPSASPASSGGIPANAYNQMPGTLHPMQTVHPASLQILQNNGWLGNVDEVEDHSGSSLGTSAEYDNFSNNGSCSGESEDPKDKVAASTASTARTETIPGCDTDKRDKIRWKNERKHQRQREKRAQELHERCSGFLMSRKLETLSQQLVAMGFPAERATMALIMNEGRVEDSVSWLFDGGMESEQVYVNGDASGNLKIDISEELARIAEIEIKFKLTKQEVERAVVTCEGDLEKAVEFLKAQKQEAPPSPPKAGEIGAQTTMNGARIKVVSSVQAANARSQGKAAGSESIQMQNHSKILTSGMPLPEEGNLNMQLLPGLQLKDWARAQTAALVGNRWPAASATQPASHSLALSSQVSPMQVKIEVRNAPASGDVKSILKVGALREPVTVMQRPQSIKVSHNPVSTTTIYSSSPPLTAGWYPTGGTGNIGTVKATDPSLAHDVRTLNLGTKNSSLNHQFLQQSRHGPVEAGLTGNGAAGWSGSWSTAGVSNGASSFSLQSSLGSFTPNGSGMSYVSPSSSDWCMDGLLSQCDYTSIDWSHDLTPFRGSGPTSLKTDRLHETWSTSFMGATTARPAISRGRVPGLRENDLASVGSYDWTTPFTGKDLLRPSRQFVSSPPL